MEEPEGQIKIFVGGLTVQTTEMDLEDYFSAFGPISQVTIIRNKKNNMSKGYGFIYMSDERTQERIMTSEHEIDGRVIDCKQGFNRLDQPERYEQSNRNKVYVGGLSPETVDKDLITFFEHEFGTVVKAYVIIDPKTQKSRKFGFVVFEEEEAAKNALEREDMVLNEEPIFCKKFGKLRYGSKTEEEKEAEKDDKLSQEKEHLSKASGSSKNILSEKDINSKTLNSSKPLTISEVKDLSETQKEQSKKVQKGSQKDQKSLINKQKASSFTSIGDTKQSKLPTSSNQHQYFKRTDNHPSILESEVKTGAAARRRTKKLKKTYELTYQKTQYNTDIYFLTNYKIQRTDKNSKKQRTEVDLAPGQTNLQSNYRFNAFLPKETIRRCAVNGIKKPPQPTKVVPAVFQGGLAGGYFLSSQANYLHQPFFSPLFQL